MDESSLLPTSVSLWDIIGTCMASKLHNHLWEVIIKKEPSRCEGHFEGERCLWLEQGPPPTIKWCLDCDGVYPLCQISLLQVPTLHCPASQDDFRFQRSELQAALLKHKLTDLYPKFHCDIAYES